MWPAYEMRPPPTRTHRAISPSASRKCVSIRPRRGRSSLSDTEIPTIMSSSASCGRIVGASLSGMLPASRREHSRCHDIESCRVPGELHHFLEHHQLILAERRVRMEHPYWLALRRHSALLNRIEQPSN